MRRSRQVLRLLAVALLAFPLLGCNGESGGSPQPPTDLHLTWVNFDEIVAMWTPPSSPVDRYVAEGRIESGSWEVINDQIPANATGGYVTLEAATPELLTIGVRMCSVRGSRSSEYTPEATLFRSLRSPSALVVHAQYEDVALTWTQDSTKAEAILVERTGGDSGAYETVARLPASASSWLDSTTGAPGLSYGYRITNLATYRGAEVRSEAVQRYADYLTTLSPPANLLATVGGGGVQLSWTPTSRNGTAQRIERTEAAFVNFTTLAVLDARAASYVDPAPLAGPYLYRVTVESAVGGWAASSDALAFVPPPAGPWGLEQEILHVPYADSVALGSDGAWWFARHWAALGPLAPIDTGVWMPFAGGWDVQRLPGSQGGEYLVNPGVLLDPSGDPHVLWLLNVDPLPTTSPRLQLRHSWRSGAVWHDELVAERVFVSGNIGYFAQFALDGLGVLHVVWRATETAGSTMLTLNEYANNASGGWSVTSLPVTLVEVSYVSSFRLSAAPDGTAHVTILGSIPASSQFGMVLLRRLPGGSWTEEIVPTGELAYYDFMLLVARGTDDVDLLYTRQVSGLLPAEYRFQSRTNAGWGSAVTLGEAFLGSGYLLPGLATTPDGARRAALLELTDGLNLAIWEASAGWATGRIHPTVPFDFPWLGFDAQKAVHVLLPGGSAGTDGYADRIHLRSTK